MDKEIEQINLFDEEIVSPLKEFEMIKSLFGKCYSVNKDNRNYLLENFKKCYESDLINEEDKNKLLIAYIDVMYKNYNYNEAEKYINILTTKDINDFIINFQISEYYILTRRYDKAEYYLNKSISECNNSDYDLLLSNKKDEILDRKYGKGYYPSQSENKLKYYLFMKSLGISVDKPIIKNKDESNNNIIVEKKEDDFDTFVAFDIETTGFDSNRDMIIELSAIRVINGKLIESKEFVFTELVHPYKIRISDSVEKLTGITNEMVSNSREIWDVIKSFKKWIGNDILVGYNCMNFDSKFISRAARISKIVIDNKYFDVMKYAKKQSSKLNCNNIKLSTLSEYLNIPNPRSHRALADATTTARVYLKLKSMKNND